MTNNNISDYKKNTEVLQKDSLICNTPHQSESMNLLISMQDAYQYRSFPQK